MKPIYIQELKKYSPSNFKELLGLSEVHYKLAIKELQTKRILKVAKDGKLTLQFVGVILCMDRLIFCYPKYIKNTAPPQTMKQLITLLREYSTRERLDQDEVETFGDLEGDSNYNLLSIIMFLMSDYLTNDLYQNDKNVYVLNGENGEIDWNKTINDQYALINNGEPIYLDYYVNSVMNDERDYFRLLHMYVLNECSRILEESGLSEYLGFQPVSFDVDEEFLGSSEIILSKIANELSSQFVNRKQMVLKGIASFITHHSMLEESEVIEFYGTRNFEIVWEKICGFVLDNQYHRVKNFIAKPTWHPLVGGSHTADTLIPDVISIFNRGHRNYFLISDAKYYNITLNKSRLSHNPGVGDVTKQYLYQLALKELMEQKNVDTVHNVLLFPTEQDSIEYIGEVTIEFLKSLGLEDILLVKLPVQKVFYMYINYVKMSLPDLGNYLDGNVGQGSKL